MAITLPFELTVSGKAEIPHPAERALINVTVSSEGTNKPSVSDEVITTAKHIETLLRELSPVNGSPEAKAAAPLAHWDKKSLSSTSHVPQAYNEAEKKYEYLPRQYNASITFDIRFKEFKALGPFGVKISSLPHVEVANIDWILTDVTEKAYRGRLRKEAAQDALEKAKQYCEVLGCHNVRPTELQETNISVRAIGRGRRMAYSNAVAQSAPGHISLQSAQISAQGGGFTRRRGGGGQSIEDEDEHSAALAQQEAELEFRPQEVRMTHEITIKFQADPATPAAHKRVSGEDMGEREIEMT